MIVGALMYQCLYAGGINLFCSAVCFVFVVDGDPYRRPLTTSAESFRAFANLCNTILLCFTPTKMLTLPRDSIRFT
jgi:hypothetical protein